MGGFLVGELEEAEAKNWAKLNELGLEACGTCGQEFFRDEPLAGHGCQKCMPSDSEEESD